MSKQHCPITVHHVFFDDHHLLLFEFGGNFLITLRFLVQNFLKYVLLILLNKLTHLLHFMFCQFAINDTHIGLYFQQHVSFCLFELSL